MVAVTRLKNIHLLTIWNMMSYRVIILRKSLFHQQIWQIIPHKFFRVYFFHNHVFLLNTYSKIFWLYCHVKFPFKLFEKMVNKRDFLKIINLYQLQLWDVMLWYFWFLMIFQLGKTLMDISTPDLRMGHPAKPLKPLDTQ